MDMFMDTVGPQGCHSAGYYPAQSWPSHITHSFGQFGFPEPNIAALTKALDRLAAAIEKHNELTADIKRGHTP